MSITDRAAKVADEILDYFQNLQVLGNFAGEPVHQQKKTFLILALRNFAIKESAEQTSAMRGEK